MTISVDTPWSQPDAPLSVVIVTAFCCACEQTVPLSNDKVAFEYVAPIRSGVSDQKLCRWQGPFLPPQDTAREARPGSWAATTMFDASQAAAAAQGHVQVVWGACRAIGLVVRGQEPCALGS